MTLSKVGILSVVELILYLIVAPFVLYLTFRHGRHALLGYFYLNVACAVRIAADVINITVDAKSNGGPTLAGTVVGSVGLSPEILALAGFLHEVHISYINAAPKATNANKTVRWTWFAQLQFHTITVIGMVLIIIGAIHLITADTTTQIKSGSDLRQAGAVLILITWIGLFIYSGGLLYWINQKRAELNQSIWLLAKWSNFASILIGVKVIYVMVYTFEPNDHAINPFTGSFAVKVLLTVLIALAAVVALTYGGWRSRDISKSITYTPMDPDTEKTAYEGARLMA